MFSDLLMTKYQEMSDLNDKMTRRRVDDRVQNIEEILKNKNLWGLKKFGKLGDEKFDVKEEFEKILKLKNFRTQKYLKFMSTQCCERSNY